MLLTLFTEFQTKVNNYWSNLYIIPRRLALLRLLPLALFFFLFSDFSIQEASDWKSLMGELRVSKGASRKSRPFAFYRFLDLYLEEVDSPLNQSRIMRAYYEEYSTEPYRLPALMFIYNPYRPWNPPQDKLILDFLEQHSREPLVQELFFYRYGSIKFERPLSFHRLYQKLEREIKGFSFSSLQGLHFMDLMISKEATSSNYEGIRKTLARLWRKEFLLESGLRNEFRDWIQKAMGLYARPSQNFLPRGVGAFKSSRERFFSRYGYAAPIIIRMLEEKFRLGDSLKTLPDFLPQKP
jgi:hypothetical protein